MDSKRIVAFKSNLKRELDVLVNNSSQKYNSTPQVETKPNTNSNKPVTPKKTVDNKPVNTKKTTTPKPTNQPKELSDYDKCLQAPYNVFVKEHRELITLHYDNGTQLTYLDCLMILYENVLYYGMVSDSGKGSDCYFTRKPSSNGGYLYTQVSDQNIIYNLQNKVIAYNNLFK